MPDRTEIAGFLEVPTSVEKLAELFPSASPVRISVLISTMCAGRERLRERTVLEFGTANEVLFGSDLPLEFEDIIRIVSPDNESFDVRARVVALRYDGGRKAVAARFVSEVENWIITP